MPKDPHRPYGPEDVGGSDSLWSREQLTPEEREIADRGVGDQGWNSIHAGYHAAALQRAAAVTAEVAERQLGAEHVDTVGVVP